MEEENISVTQELISKTMDSIRGQSYSNFETTSNNKRWRNKFNITNIAVAVLLVVIIGTGIGKQLYDESLSHDLASLENDAAYEIAENQEAAEAVVDGDVVI